MSAADLGGFLEAAGRSLGDAQEALVGDISDVPTSVAISTAELEAKVGFSRAADGSLLLDTVSVADIAKGGIEVGALSTVKVQFAAVAEEAVTPGPRPTKTAPEVIDAVKKRPDVVVLDRILDGLRFEAVFVPPTRRWLVRATDAQERVVREVLVPDA
jgi:hypothetical protein